MSKDYTKFSNPKITEKTVEIETPVMTITAEAEIDITEDAIVKNKIGTVDGCVRLNVREEPSIEAEVVTIIKKGEAVEIFEEESTEEFYKVCAATGAEGFCMRKFVTINP